MSRGAAMMLLAALLAAVSCSGSPKASTAPHVWVPRASSHGLNIDQESSRVREIYVPAAASAAADQGE